MILRFSGPSRLATLCANARWAHFGGSFRRGPFGRLTAGALLMAGAAAVLSSCAGTPKGICPRVAIVDRLSQLTAFRPGAPETAENVMFTAEMTNIRITCEYQDARLNLPRAVTSNVEATITIRRGPAMEGSRARFQYFLVITDRRGTVLNKKVYNASVSLGGRVTTYTAESYQRYDLRRGGSGLLFENWMGFQLSERQVQYNNREAQ